MKTQDTNIEGTALGLQGSSYKSTPVKGVSPLQGLRLLAPFRLEQLPANAGDSTNELLIFLVFWLTLPGFVSVSGAAPEGLQNNPLHRVMPLISFLSIKLRILGTPIFLQDLIFDFCVHTRCAFV